MPVLIGGSPSTGSSLLRQMLNRHSAIYCGPETQLFTHPGLFINWNKSKTRLLNKPLLTSPDLHLIRGVNLAGEEQAWFDADIRALINDSEEFSDFCENYFSKSTQQYDKRIWMDKTPSNVLSFEPFLHSWKEAYVVHIVRDPLDIIASLVSRGLPLFLAVSRYLFNTSHALKSAGDERYILLMYESLVSSPEDALRPLLDSIGLQYEAAMVEDGNPEMRETHQMPGWRSSEIESPNKKSVGRFNSLSEKEQRDIIESLGIVEIAPGYGEKNGIKHFSAREMAESCSYRIPTMSDKPGSEVLKRLRAEQRIYRQNCLKERRLFYERERPIVLLEN